MTPGAQQPYFCPHCGVRSDRATINSEVISEDIPHAWVCYNCGWKWIDVDIMQKNIRTRPHTQAPDEQDLRTIGQIKRDIRRLAECDPAIKEYLTEQWDKAARTATLAECERIYGLFHEVEMLHLNGMAYPDLYNEMVARIKFIHTEPLSKDGRKKK
jgi:hypothetical protein